MPDKSAAEKQMTGKYAPKAEVETQAFDLHRLLVEIDDEVRAKRASGELPPELERELDLVFARFAPAGALDGDFDQLMERAEQQAFFDLLAPNESVRKGVPQVKRVVQKTVRWYLRYVVDQITGFAHTMTKAVRQLGDRVDRVEQLSAPQEELDAALARLGPRFDAQWHAYLVEAFRGAGGRVLHARCGSGALVKDLRGAGVDAYGVDPAPSLVSAQANDTGLDLRPDEERSHLNNLAPGVLGGLVLTGSPDVLPRGAQIELIDLASIVLARGAKVALVVANPAAWERTHSAIEVDLAPGRPMHIETWQHLLEDRGFTNVVVEAGARDGSLNHVPGSDETSAAVNANVDQLNQLLFPPASHVIVATR